MTRRDADGRGGSSRDGASRGPKAAGVVAPRGARKLGIGALLLAPSVGCQPPLRDDLGAAGTSAAASFEPIRPAAPRRDHVLERAGERCVLYVVDAGERALGDAVTCPRSLEDGERLRLAGRTCLRESSDPARQGPVACAPALVDAAEAELAPRVAASAAPSASSSAEAPRPSP